MVPATPPAIAHPRPPGPRPIDPPPQDAKSSTLSNVPGRQIIIIVSPNRNKQSPKTMNVNNLRRGRIVFPVSLQITRLLRRRKIAIIVAHHSSDALSLRDQISVTGHSRNGVFIDVRTGTVDVDHPSIGKIRACFTSRDNQQLTTSLRSDVVTTAKVGSHNIGRTQFFILHRAGVPTTLIRMNFIAKTRSTPQLTSPT